MRIPVSKSAFLAVLICFTPATLAGAEVSNRAAALLVEVQLEREVKLSHLKPDDRLHGRVKRDVYSGERQLIPSGSPIDLRVAKIERRRRQPNFRWPWVVRLFTPRHVNYPSLLAAVVYLPDGSKLPIGGSLVSASQQIRLTAQGADAARTRGVGKIRSANSSVKHGTASDAAPTLVLAWERPLQMGPPSSDSVSGPSTAPESLATGTVAHIVLLDSLRASKNHTGDAFQARLAEPVRLGSRVVLPEGVLVQGTVVRSVPPRWLSRSGSLSLTFSQLRFPGGETAAIAASPSAVVVDRASGLRMDAEGALKGGSPGKLRLLIDCGVAGGIAKVSDDTFQLIAKSLISTATDASTAGSARFVAAALSGLYLVTRHGRDVFLPPYTRIDISFDRPALLPSRSSP